jgi:hypothetical protein
VQFDPDIWRGNNTAGLQVIFDMGTPTNLLPNSLYFAIGGLYPDATPSTHRLGFPAYKVPCDAPFGTFNYIFGDQTIKYRSWTRYTRMAMTAHLASPLALKTLAKSLSSLETHS